MGSLPVKRVVRSFFLPRTAGAVPGSLSDAISGPGNKLWKICSSTYTFSWLRITFSFTSLGGSSTLDPSPFNFLAVPSEFASISAPSKCGSALPPGSVAMRLILFNTIHGAQPAF